MKNNETLYRHLGYLFYSIAAADKHINAAEIETLKHAVTEKWLAIDESTDEFGTDTAHYISIAFDYLTEVLPAADNAYKHFETYYNNHKEVFTPALKSTIMETALLISHSFAGSNKAELNILGRLVLLFQK